ncbi:MAG: DUF3332 family protein [Myxococcota bacterium]
MSMRRAVVLISLWTAIGPGCFGSFRLTGAVWDFNHDLSDSAVVRELVFLAFVIVPVYPVAAVGDLLVVNTAEAITGKDPLVKGTAGGRSVAATRTADGVVLTVDGDRVRRLVRRGRAVVLVDAADGAPIATVDPQDDGSVVVTDGTGTRTIARDRVEAATAAARQGPDALVDEVRAALAR